MIKAKKHNTLWRLCLHQILLERIRDYDLNVSRKVTIALTMPAWNWMDGMKGGGGVGESQEEHREGGVCSGYGGSNGEVDYIFDLESRK